MTREIYDLIDSYMKGCMKDSAHDIGHVYRVLYNALTIAESCDGVDNDVLVCACLLHDIARAEQLADHSICHAAFGAKKAYSFLMDNGFDEKFAAAVKHCIRTHRFRSDDPPQSIEAKILFDADKLDVAGAVGIARTLVYKGAIGDPLYSLNEDGAVSDGSDDKSSSFFHEYKFKLEKIYDRFFTEKGAEMARERQKAASDFYHSLYSEVSCSGNIGRNRLEKILK